MQITLNNITDEKVSRAVQAIKNNGGIVNANIFNVQGISGSYIRRGDAVVINITSKPWYIPEGTIERKLREFFS